MSRERPHHHPCWSCGLKVECHGIRTGGHDAPCDPYDTRPDLRVRFRCEDCDGEEEE